MGFEQADASSPPSRAVSLFLPSYLSPSSCAVVRRLHSLTAHMLWCLVALYHWWQPLIHLRCLTPPCNGRWYSTARPGVVHHSHGESTVGFLSQACRLWLASLPAWGHSFVRSTNSLVGPRRPLLLLPTRPPSPRHPSHSIHSHLAPPGCAPCCFSSQPSNVASANFPTSLTNISPFVRSQSSSSPPSITNSHSIIFVEFTLIHREYRQSFSARLVATNHNTSELSASLPSCQPPARATSTSTI